MREAYRPNRKRRIGLQAKAAIILTLVVSAATGGGGWLYLRATHEMLDSNDRLQAERLASGLAAGAAPALKTADREALHKLATDLLRHSNVHFIRLLDADGKPITTAERVRPGLKQYQLASLPTSMSYGLDRGGDFLELGRPILAAGKAGQRDKVVGAMRLVMDTRQTAASLARVRREIILIAAAIILCSIPVGHVLVCRIMIVPIRRLLSATRRLADGDFSVRADTKRTDEIGELACAFDTMVERLQASRKQLRDTNESLERKIAERTAELEQTNRRLCDEMSEKEDFLRAVSHDLNAPLRNIAGMATMISMKHRDQLPEEALARLQRIQANVDVETDLLNELLEISRIKSRPQKRELVDFHEMLSDLGGAFEYELKQRGVSYHVVGPMPQLFVEKIRMRGVFQNLVDNAIKYMTDRRDAKIEIAYRLQDGQHCFYVADNGPGISETDQQKIFCVFRRASTSAGTQGKGVGLAWSKTVVSNYDGNLTVKSTPGEGSVFVVTLSERLTGGKPAPTPGRQAEERTHRVAADVHPVS